MLAATNVDDFLARFDEPNRAELSRIRRIIAQSVPEAIELICYGIPSFRYKGKYLAGYSSFKKHLSLFPGGAPIELLKDKLVGYKLSAGTVQFTLNNPLPDALIEELVTIRVRAIDER